MNMANLVVDEENTLGAASKGALGCQDTDRTCAPATSKQAVRVSCQAVRSCITVAYKASRHVQLWLCPLM